MDNVLKELVKHTGCLRKKSEEYVSGNDGGMCKSAPEKWFSDVEYWEERYANESKDAKFEWFLSFQEVQPIMCALISKVSKILHIGCGNSDFGVELFKCGLGIRGVINTDICPLVIERMNKLHQSLHQVEWHVDDVLHMKFTESSFDCVVDKGCLDALLCNPTKTMKKRNSNFLLEEVFRVLKPNGKFIIISFGQPEVRLNYFDCNQFDVCYYVVTPYGKPSTFIYTLNKTSP